MCTRNLGQTMTGINEKRNCTTVEEWDIMKLLTLEDENTPAYGIVVLNQPISHNRTYIIRLWKNAKVTQTVDGGTDHWDTFLQQLDGDTQSSLRPPDLITGDFDSVREKTLEKYKKKGSKIVCTPDQNETDFTKAVVQMNSYCIEKDIPLDSIIVLLDTSGRLDQIMANINTLFLIRQNKLLQNANTEVYLMTKDSVSWLLRNGEHVIHIPQKLRLRLTWCALIPVGEECTRVTTTGLKWNLVNGSLKFGAIVSTSNTYDGSPTVRIRNSHPLLWCMNISELLPEGV